MGRSIDEIMNQLPEERRNRIIAESERLEAEYQIRQILCKAEKLTQSQWAEILSTQQAAVSNTE